MHAECTEHDHMSVFGTQASADSAYLVQILAQLLGNDVPHILQHGILVLQQVDPWYIMVDAYRPGT